VQYHDFIDNNAWYREIAAGWARRMINGDSPGAWANNTDAEIQFAIRQIGLQTGDRVLDLGCGWGRHSLPLAAWGLHVTGLDLSHDLLTLARYTAKRRGLAIDWVEGDLSAAPLRGSFDAVVQFCGNFMTWFADRQRTLDALWHVARLLRPGGRLMFGTEDWQPDLPPRAQDWDEWQGGAAIYRHRYDDRCRIAQTQTVIFGPAHQRREFHRKTWWPSRLEMETLFEQAGFAIQDRTNTCAGGAYDPRRPGLVYLLERS
jgi:2-polyprenyl-3-methyl-5-hydroxy-6-metoxy-1,4-benzoquinol methylase